ncbi:MAG: acetyl-CoA carboxylase biotin carboxyl carrier protein [Burkholderiaceae bacterium]
MDLRKLKTLIDLVADSTIAELEVTEGDSKVRIVKTLPAGQQPMQYMPMQMQQMPAAAATSAPAAVAIRDDDKSIEIDGNVVKSPMVGTFYRSPSPDKPTYVEIGSIVKVAEPVCIIEAMKLLNEIEAGFDGTIKEILVENGQPVEFGQPLFIIG